MAQYIHILLASHTPTATTGYGRVMRRVAQAFHNAGHTVTALGSGYNGESHDLPYPILAWPNDRPAESLAAALRDIRADVLLTIGDPWMFDFVPEHDTGTHLVLAGDPYLRPLIAVDLRSCCRLCDGIAQVVRVRLEPHRREQR